MTKDDLNSQQISQDSLMAYLGIRGLGRSKTKETTFARTFPAMFILMYWDTYKNYYANKQEEVGCVITQGQGLIKTIAAENQSSTTEDVANAPALKWETVGGNAFTGKWRLRVDFTKNLAKPRLKRHASHWQNCSKSRK